MPQNKEGLEYLIVELACEMNENDTREKKDVNENRSMGDDEKIEAQPDEGSFADEDWNEPDQSDVP